MDYIWWLPKRAGILIDKIEAEDETQIAWATQDN